MNKDNKTMTHLAIDCETLSLEANAHLLSIGAVFFDPFTGSMGSEFYVVIDLEKKQPNADISSATVAWWLKQPTGVFPKALFPKPLEEALILLFKFIRFNKTSGQPLNVYQQGDRDAMWLDNAAKNYGMSAPWRYNRVYCSRTLADHHSFPITFKDYKGQAHNALDDAKWVAVRMLEVLK